MCAVLSYTTKNSGILPQKSQWEGADQSVKDTSSKT